MVKYCQIVESPMKKVNQGAGKESDGCVCVRVNSGRGKYQELGIK